MCCRWIIWGSLKKNEYKQGRNFPVAMRVMGAQPPQFGLMPLKKYVLRPQRPWCPSHTAIADFVVFTSASFLSMWFSVFFETKTWTCIWSLFLRFIKLHIRLVMVYKFESLWSCAHTHASFPLLQFAINLHRNALKLCLHIDTSCFTTY